MNLASTLGKLWRTALDEETPLRLFQVLERRGKRAPDLDSDLYAGANAVRRCVFCRARAECDAWLASGRRDGLEQFCPNAGFVAHSPER